MKVPPMMMNSTYRWSAIIPDQEAVLAPCPRCAPKPSTARLALASARTDRTARGWLAYLWVHTQYSSVCYSRSLSPVLLGSIWPPVNSDLSTRDGRTHTQILPVIAICGHRWGLHITATTAIYGASGSVVLLHIDCKRTPLAVLIGRALSFGSRAFL